MPASYLALMTLHDFNNLSDEVQLAYLYKQGTYLARRWDNYRQAVQLYQLPAGFFVEHSIVNGKKAVCFCGKYQATNWVIDVSR